MYVVEKGLAIPAPKGVKGRSVEMQNLLNAIPVMLVGDSIFMGAGTPFAKGNCFGALAMMLRKDRGWRVAFRKEGYGSRMWRIA